MTNANEPQTARFYVGQRVIVKGRDRGYPPEDKPGTIEEITTDMYGVLIATVQLDNGLNGGGLHLDELEPVDGAR